MIRNSRSVEVWQSYVHVRGRHWRSTGVSTREKSSHLVRVGGVCWLVTCLTPSLWRPCRWLSSLSSQQLPPVSGPALEAGRSSRGRGRSLYSSPHSSPCDNTGTSDSHINVFYTLRLTFIWLSSSHAVITVFLVVETPEKLSGYINWKVRYSTNNLQLAFLNKAGKWVWKNFILTKWQYFV